MQIFSLNFTLKGQLVNHYDGMCTNMTRNSIKVIAKSFVCFFKFTIVGLNYKALIV